MEIGISSRFRAGNQWQLIAKFGHFAQIFHGHFCQLAENHGFLKSWSKKGRALL
ncbi:hypothetical protein KTQ96_11305 [Prevotella copri]|jgi:hypothetical protein|uniref:hypothetical protein n=1 Tax=Segatella copri TaxID=165179 RepID=UPI001C2C531B|nr:hypothetical protein [Segatella copri]MBU9908516.1 hypothetical protein [Segatella copri]MBV3374011.1 hypothetical protein [Segatella copri]